MRRILPVLCSACLAAGEAPADPTAFLPVEAVAAVHAPDLARSRTRWEQTPFAALARTPWGRISADRLAQLLGRFGPDLPAACTAAEAVAAGLAAGEDERPDAVLAIRGDAAAMQRAAAVLLPAEVPRRTTGRVLACAAAPASATGVRGPARAPHDPEADLLLTYEPARLPALLARLAPQAPALPLADGAGTVLAGVRLDAIGLRERWQLPLHPALRQAWPALRAQRADPAFFASLPRTALCALSGRCDPAATRAILDQPQLAAGLAPVEDAFRRLGLPGYAETLRACDGPVAAWLEEGVPFPAATIAIGMDPLIARRWVEAAGASLHLPAQPDGARAGFAGIVPLAIACEPADGGKALLVVTSSPQGLDAWRKRPGGFAEHAEIKAALRELPADAILAGVSRSGASWAAIAQLAVLPLSQIAPPQIMSLPQDLRQAGRHGYLWLRLEEQGARLEAGGLFGGPLGWILTGAGIGGGIGAHQAAVAADRRARRVAPAPEPEPAPAPVF